MCGIIGMLDKTGNSQENKRRLNNIVDTLYHRGPDGKGTWSDKPVYFGHTRLSIIDLSEKGKQPMTKNGMTINYNGEVYNYKELRKELETKGYSFDSNTDTEVVLRAYECWGPKALDKFNGMYALGIWDSNKKELFLARDRLGIKPLYYYSNKDNFLFGSEVKSLLYSGKIAPKINWEKAFKEFFSNSHFQKRGDTLIKGIEELLPGHYAVVKPDGQKTIKRYWDLPESKLKSVANKKISDNLKELMYDSIKLRLRTDVPIGAFLSGGLDSSLINAISKEYLSNVNCFTVDYNCGVDPNTSLGNEDLKYSKLLADKLSLNHKIINGNQKITLQNIDEVVDIATFSDDARLPSIFKNYEIARDLGLTVILNGQGADEIMGGYYKFDVMRNHLINYNKKNTFYPFMFCNFNEEILNQKIIKTKREALEELIDYREGFGNKNLEKSHKFLTKTLLSRILQFEDFLSMANGIECRVPYLDHRIVELAFKIPFEKHIKGYDGKMLMRKAAKNILPKELINRPKQAFPIKNPEILQKELYSIYSEYHKEIKRSELLNKIFKKEFLNNKELSNQLSGIHLWKILSMWRWEDSLNKIKIFKKNEK